MDWYRPEIRLTRITKVSLRRQATNKLAR